MCEPTTIMMGISLAIAAASAAMAAQQQAKAAKRAEQDQKDKAEYDMAVFANEQRNFAIGQDRVNLREDQERTAAGEKAFDTRIESLKGKARAEAASSEVAGISVDALLADFSGAEGRANMRNEANLNSSLDQINAERGGLFSKLESARLMAGAPMRAVNKPSMAGLGLSIAGAAADTGAAYYAKNPGTSRDLSMKAIPTSYQSTEI